MTLTEVDGEVPVAPRAGYPKVVPYGPDAGAHSIDFQPAADLDPCTEYRVDVTDALVDADGEAVTPHAWAFRTDGCPDPIVRPDAQLRIGATGAFIGADVFGANGGGQEWSVAVPRGRSATFVARFRNAGTEPDRLRITGQPRQGAVTVRYFQGTQDVTGRVVAGTYRTAVLAPRTAATLRVVMAMAANAGPNAHLTRLITASSEADPSKVDGVRATVTRARRSANRAESTEADIEALLADPEAMRLLQVCQLDPA
jgi:hypothetical protein